MRLVSSVFGARCERMGFVSSVFGVPGNVRISSDLGVLVIVWFCQFWRTCELLISSVLGVPVNVCISSVFGVTVNLWVS